MSERLREARIAAGFESASDAAREFGWERSTYGHHENGTRPFNVEQAKRYARAFRVNPGWLLALDKVQAVPISTEKERIVEVTGAVAAGIWRETWEWSQDRRYEVVVGRSPFPHARHWGLEVEGFSMDQLYQPGTILICASIFDIKLEPDTGDVVIVERVRADGTRELTVKEFLRDEEDRRWLVPRSNKPEFQAPIEIGRPDYDHIGEDRIQVIAYVVGDYNPRAQRLLERARRAGLM